jgi:hypothetical protein
MRIVSAAAQPVIAPEVPAAADGDGAAPVRSTLRFDAGAASADGVPAAPAADAQRRLTLERELDRVQGALQTERTAYSQQLNWLMLSQGLFLNAYLLVLVLGFGAPLPAKRWLLGGLAVFAAGVALLIYVALRGSRDAAQALRQQRRRLEETLQRDFGRAPVFVPRSVVTRGLSGLAASLLPGTFIAGWVALTLYSLAAPLNALPSGQAAATGTPAGEPAARAAMKGAAGARATGPAAPRGGPPERLIIEAPPIPDPPGAAAARTSAGTPP